MNDSQKKTQLHWVYESIVNWANFSSDRKELIEAADMGFSTFYFLRGIVDTDDIHAYMGFYEDTIYMHFIPSSFDIPASFTDEMAIPSELHSCIGTKLNAVKGPVLKAEAEDRISNWSDKTIRDGILSAPELFQMFWIPNDDFEGNTPIQVDLAANNNQPDLILTQLNQMDSFFNTCKPIPPFKPSFVQTQFALYEQVLLWKI